MWRTWLFRDLLDLPADGLPPVCPRCQAASRRLAERRRRVQWQCRRCGVRWWTRRPLALVIPWTQVLHRRQRPEQEVR